MGHIAPVNSVDFASGNSDYLVTSGRDRAVKIWHWRSKAVKLNIDLRKQGRGTGNNIPRTNLVKNTMLKIGFFIWHRIRKRIGVWQCLWRDNGPK